MCFQVCQVTKKNSTLTATWRVFFLLYLFVNAIRVLYEHSNSRVYIEGQVSEPFEITTGVLLGDDLAPFLFNIVFDYITKLSEGEYSYLTHKGTITTNIRSVRSSTRSVDRRVSDLSFADDIALLESENTRAQGQLDSLKHHASTVGLEINIPKTEQMRLNLPDTSPSPPPLHIDGQPIRIVDEFNYLGSYMGSTDKDINNRIGLAWAAFNRLKPILTSRSGKPTVKIKIRLFNAACISILLNLSNLVEFFTEKGKIFKKNCPFHFYVNLRNLT